MRYHLASERLRTWWCRFKGEKAVLTLISRRTALVVAFLVGTGLWKAAGSDEPKRSQVHSLADPRPLAIDGGEMEVRLEVVREQDATVLTVRFCNPPNGRSMLFNPYLNGLLPRPYMIAIFDPKGRYLGATPPMKAAVSSRGPDFRDWVHLDGDSELVVRKRIPDGKAVVGQSDLKFTSLKGDESFQVICSEVLTTPPQSDGTGGVKQDRYWVTEWNNWKQDVGRSNVARIESR
jgi:hypothetical protein